MNNIRLFLLKIEPRVITCEEVDHKPTRARLFAGGAGLQFYVNAPTVGIVDKLANVVMNKAIELNGTTRGVTLERIQRNPAKIPTKQLKLL